MNVLEPPPVPDLSTPTIAALREHLLGEIEHTPDAPRRTRRLLIGGVAALAAAAAIIVGVTIGNTSTPSADAAWNAVPSPVAAQLTLVEALCRGVEWAPAFAAGQHVVVAERRQRSYMLVFAGDDNKISDCMLAHPYSAGPEATVGGWSQNTTTSQRLARPAGSAATLVGGGSETHTDPGSSTSTTRTYLYGRSGPGVAKITFRIGGNTGSATVTTGGWWAAWYPGSAPIPTSVQVTDRTGQVHRQPIG